MNKIGYKSNHPPYRKRFLCPITTMLVMPFAIIVAFSTLYLSWILNTDAIKTILLFCIHIVITMIARATQLSIFFLYSYLLLNIRARFGLLNMALRNANGIPNANRRLHQITSARIIELVNRVAVQHDHMTAGVELINKCYSFQVSLRLNIYSISCIVLFFQINVRVLSSHT